MKKHSNWDFCFFKHIETFLKLISAGECPPQMKPRDPWVRNGGGLNMMLLEIPAGRGQLCFWASPKHLGSFFEVAFCYKCWNFAKRAFCYKRFRPFPPKWSCRHVFLARSNHLKSQRNRSKTIGDLPVFCFLTWRAVILMITYLLTYLLCDMHIIRLPWSVLKTSKAGINTIWDETSGARNTILYRFVDWRFLSIIIMMHYYF